MTVAAQTRDRAWGWLSLCGAALLFTVGVGLWQAEPIQQFRRPSVQQTLTIGERTVVDGVAYRLTSLTSAPELPVQESSLSSYPSGVVGALPGAELVLVVLTVERIDPARDPGRVFCEVTLQDGRGRSWTTDGTVDYAVAKPTAVTCLGGVEEPPDLGAPYEVGMVFQVPAEVTRELRVRARLSGGPQGIHVLEFRPR